MISEDEILKGKECTIEYRDNLDDLIYKLNMLRKFYGSPMTITSGLRTIEEHIEIYRKMGITDNTKIPMKSSHLFCLAVDVYDPEFLLTKFCKENEDFCKRIGLYFEDDTSQPRLHIQINAPKSGNRWFKK